MPVTLQQMTYDFSHKTFYSKDKCCKVPKILRSVKRLFAGGIPRDNVIHQGRDIVYCKAKAGGNGQKTKTQSKDDIKVDKETVLNFPAVGTRL